MQLNRREEGVALVAAIMTMLVVAGLMTLIFARTFNEVRTTRDSTEITRTLLLARAAANFGVVMLNDPIKTQIETVVANTSSSASRWAYDPSAPLNSTTPAPRVVAARLENLVSRNLQLSADAYVCNFNGYGGMQGKVAVRIYFTGRACGQDLPSSVSIPTGRFYDGIPRNASGEGLQWYTIPYVIVAEGQEGEYRRNVVIQGEYVFQVGRSSFAQFAYFTNTEAASDGGLIFFNDRTLIDGPVHTNGNFAFAYDPWFGGAVTSAGCLNPDANGRRCGGTYDGGATFRETYCASRNNRGECTSSGLRNTFVKDENMRPNDDAPSLGGTAPVFAEGVAWNARYIELPQNSNDQQKIAQGFNPDGTQRQDIGINITENLASLELRTITNAQGGAPVFRNGEWTPAAYQLIKTCTASACTLRAVYPQTTPSGEKVLRMSTCTKSESVCFANFSDSRNWTAAAKPFNGVIHVSGKIERLTGPARTNADDPNTAAPAVAAFSQLTIAATEQIRLTGDLKYEDRPVEGQPVRNENDRTVTPSEFANPDATNILGIYSSQNNIVVGNENSTANWNAPKNVEVDSVLMSGIGSILVERYDTGSSKGSFKLLGGMIQNRRGAFGQFSARGGATSGFDRVYTYDKRLKNGLAPPFFPTTGLDTVKSAEARAYGQREQVY